MPSTGLNQLAPHGTCSAAQLLHAEQRHNQCGENTESPCRHTSYLQLYEYLCYSGGSSPIRRNLNLLTRGPPLLLSTAALPAPLLAATGFSKTAETGAA